MRRVIVLVRLDRREPVALRITGDDSLAVPGPASATLAGDQGYDVLTGGGGADVLDGGTGGDSASGGAGADSIVLRDKVADIATCGPGRDSVRAEVPPT